MERTQQTYGCIACGNSEQWDDIHWFNSHDGVCDKCYNKVPAFVKDYLCNTSEEGMNDNQLELLIGSIRYKLHSIETKFHLGQPVWTMFDNKPVEVIVTSIEPGEQSINKDGKTYAKSPIMYHIKRAKESYDPMDAYGRQLPQKEWEYKLFPSKEALCTALLNEKD